jgi:hypothetical protein
MRKFFMMIVMVLISFTMYAQIGLGYSESKIRATKKADETIETKYTEGGKVIMIKNEHFARFYFINEESKCDLYTVLPLSNDACDLFLDVCNSKFTKLGDGKWRTQSNGKYVYVYMMFDEELEEHVYYFLDDEDDEFEMNL